MERKGARDAIALFLNESVIIRLGMYLIPYRLFVRKIMGTHTESRNQNNTF